MLTYGCVVWAKAAERKYVKANLNKLQRLGLTSIANVRRSTPTAALEIIYDIPPIHLQIKEKAMNTFLRLGDLKNTQWTPHNRNQLGHLKNLRNILASIEDDDETPPPKQTGSRHTQ